MDLIFREISEDLLTWQQFLRHMAVVILRFDCPQGYIPTETLYFRKIFISLYQEIAWILYMRQLHVSPFS